MKILLLNAYYEPEKAASLYLSTNLYEDFAVYGFDVELYTPIPTRGISDEVRKEYNKKRLEVKSEGRLKIHRFWVPREGKGTVIRAFRYFFLNIVLIFKALTVKTDFIFVQSTPPTQGAMAAILKKIKKVPLVYNLQDIFPDSLVNTGLIKEQSIIWKIGRVIENFTYRNADKIIVISEDLKRNIMAKGVPDDKIEVAYNWVEADNVTPIRKEDNILYKRFNLDKSVFYVVYAGNLGYAQNIEVIIATAKLLQEHPVIQFLIFGKGTQEKLYKQMAYDLSLNNIRFLPIQPYEEVSHVYSLGDICIVSCKAGFGGSAMPSKTWNIMSSGTAVLASFDDGTDLQSIIEVNNVGIFTKADDAEGLKDSIQKLYNNRSMCQLMGENGRKYILSNLTRNVGTKRYIDIINSMRDVKSNIDSTATTPE